MTEAADRAVQPLQRTRELLLDCRATAEQLVVRLDHPFGATGLLTTR